MTLSAFGKRFAKTNFVSDMFTDDHSIIISQSRHASSRKRGPSSSCDQGYGERDEQMNECNAALVLMSLSCSPNSPRPSGWGDRSSVSPGASSSSDSSWRSGTPSPPPASSSFSDEGIAMDYEEIHPRKKRK
ncbi:hypothetical protein SFRURICE_009664 [Spodoptera frugiperda]|nr:hypothetical protein SFRURICE_009664 [Spodoptera frugiperda]